MIGDLSGAMKKAMNESTKLLTKQELVAKTAADMQKTILLDNETLLRKVFSRLSDTDDVFHTPLCFYGPRNSKMHLCIFLSDSIIQWF